METEVAENEKFTELCMARGLLLMMAMMKGWEVTGFNKFIEIRSLKS